jgi:DNA-binding XRE family transcriptional regulator
MRLISTAHKGKTVDSITSRVYCTGVMNSAVTRFESLVRELLPKARVSVEEPAEAHGSFWIDVHVGGRRHTVEYRPEQGFGFFHRDTGFGEGPAEIYRNANRASLRLAQVATKKGKASELDLKNIRALYGMSQVELAKKAGVKQPAISRFEKRGEVKLSTLAETIRALGGKMEVRAHFSDATIPVSVPTTKGRPD